MYRHGCPCDECRDWHKHKMRKYRESKKEKK